MSRRLFLLLAMVAVILAAAFFCFDHIGICLFAKRSGLDIMYKAIEKRSLNEFILKNFIVIDKKSGNGFSSESGRIKLAWPPASAAADLDLKRFRFIKSKENAPERYDSLSALVSMPFEGRWTYSRITGRVRPLKDALSIEDFTAESEDIRLKFTGLLYYNNTIKSDIAIYFGQRLTRNIPEELLNVLLKDEEAGWKSLSVKLDGNLEKPFIQVSGKLFRLNIGVKRANKP